MSLAYPLQFCYTFVKTTALDEVEFNNAVRLRQ